MRRLDRQRLAILLSLRLLALATLAAVELQASRAAGQEEARQANHLRVVRARDELRVVQVEFWQGSAQGRRTLQTHLLTRFPAGRDALAASLAMDRDDPEIQSLAHRSLNDLDRVAALPGGRSRGGCWTSSRGSSASRRRASCAGRPWRPGDSARRWPRTKRWPSASPGC